MTDFEKSPTPSVYITRERMDKHVNDALSIIQQHEHWLNKTEHGRQVIELLQFMVLYPEVALTREEAKHLFPNP